MTKNRLVVRNASASVVQAIVSGCVLFILYRFLLHSIGIVNLGVWSVVMAFSAVARIGEAGLSGSVVRFVAKQLAERDRQKAALVIQISATWMFVVVATCLAVFYGLIVWVFDFVLPESEILIAVEILPYALCFCWITSLAGVYQAGLDGCQRIVVRSVIVIVGSVALLIVAVSLVPSYGLLGLLMAQICQACLLAILSWFFLRRVLNRPSLLPWRWDYSVFKEIFNYGLNFQVASITGLLFEPVTKSLLSKFGGLAATGYFEMASRMITQLRVIFISANQVLVPHVATMYENARAHIVSSYRQSYLLLLFLSTILFCFVCSSSPLISELWIGTYNNQFVVFSILLSAGLLVNTLAGPAYFFNLGTGDLKWNVISHVLIAVLNPLLGFLLGIWWGAEGVVLGWVFSLIMGSMLIIVAYHLRHDLPLEDIFPTEMRSYLIINLFALTISYASFVFLRQVDGGVASFICFLVFPVIVIAPFWRHPIRRSIAGRLLSQRT